MLFLYQDRIMQKEEAAISPDDRGYYFGDGVYEVFRIYNGRLFEKKLHMERLERSVKEIRIEPPYPLARIEELLLHLLQEDPVKDGTLYMQITRGVAPRVHAFPDPAQTQSVLTAYVKPLPRPTETLASGIRAVTMPDIRWLRCDIKSLNLLPNVLARQEATERGAGEAIFHRNGTVTECSSSNVMLVKQGVIRTHPANQMILHGVTRSVVLRLAERLGLKVCEEAFMLGELYEADEVFITSTGAEVTPVIEIDGKKVADGTPGTITRMLQQAFEDYAIKG